MATCHESTPAGGADGVNIVVVEDDPGVGQAVNVGGWDLVGAMEANIIPAQVIRHYDDNVGRLAPDNGHQTQQYCEHDHCGVIRECIS